MQECLNVMQTPSNTSLTTEEDTFGRFIAEDDILWQIKTMAEKKITELLFDLEYSIIAEGPSESDMIQPYNQAVTVTSNA